MTELFKVGLGSLDQPLVGQLAPEQLLIIAQLGPEEALTLCLQSDQPTEAQEQMFAKLQRSKGRRPILQLFMLFNGACWPEGALRFPETLFHGVKKRLHFKNKLRYLNLPIDEPVAVSLSLSQFKLSCLLEDELFGVKDFRLN